MFKVGLCAGHLNDDSILQRLDPSGSWRRNADVAKSVDAADLKSADHWSCGFKSRRPHHTPDKIFFFASLRFPGVWKDFMPNFPGFQHGRR